VLPPWGGTLLIALPAVFVLNFFLVYYSGAARALYGPLWAGVRLRALVPPGRADPADAARPSEAIGEAVERLPELLTCSDKEYDNNF
jgi:hypothetical protein